MDMSSIAVTKFCGIFIDGGCVTGPDPGFLLPDPGEDPDVGGASLDMY